MAVGSRTRRRTRLSRATPTPNHVYLQPPGESLTFPAQAVTAEKYLVDRDPEAVPHGTAKEVLEWVGKDQQRAARALEAEIDAASPRSSLVDKLYRLL